MSEKKSASSGAGAAGVVGLLAFCGVAAKDCAHSGFFEQSMFRAAEHSTASSGFREADGVAIHEAPELSGPHIPSAGSDAHLSADLAAGNGANDQAKLDPSEVRADREQAEEQFEQFRQANRTSLADSAPGVRTHTYSDQFISSVVNRHLLKDDSSTFPGETIARQTLAQASYTPDPRTVVGSNAKLIALAPEDDDEFLRVYGRSPSLLEQGDVGRYSQARRALGTHWGPDVNSLEALNQQLLREESPLLILLIHSTDNGHSLVLAGGQSVDLQQLYDSCAQVRKICLTLTCNSQDLGYNTEVSIFEALRIWELTAEWTAQREQVDLEQLTAFMRGARQTAAMRGSIGLVWLIPAAGGGAILCSSTVNEAQAGAADKLHHDHQRLQRILLGVLT